ncbi:MAG: YigZ family protein [Clostridia bacterium]|jgi:uncharacterized YigZ family protein|nr:YigZ family protein [Clostridia bacterium]MCI1999025.1 YigZ family protein [Clostridia bacterium]MCI2013775.1 YigZ family protein [Clostridia bacterium]
MLEDFKTIFKSGTAEIVEKKSRFIANVMPAKTEDEAKAFIDAVKKKYYDARHNVFAYQIGEKNELQRYSDDGEPQGTAGMPILTVLNGEDVKNAVIVVTRYFGGTLLGTGGLVRAYTKSAKEGLNNAGIYNVKSYSRFSVTVDYSLNGKVQFEVIKAGYIIEDTLFLDKVKFIILTPIMSSEKFVNLITEITNGKAEIQKIGDIKGVQTSECFKIYD